MVQGKTKGLQTKAPTNRQKTAKLKKGKKYIAPKKQALVKQEAMYKVTIIIYTGSEVVYLVYRIQALSTKINKSIEAQMVSAASSGKLTIMKNTSADDDHNFKFAVICQMPRRPKSSSGRAKRLRPLKRSDASIEKWNTLDDIPLDEEDEFHASRDRILLEGEIEDDIEDDEEVFALNGLDEVDSEEDEHSSEDDMDEVQEGKLSKHKPQGKKQRQKKEDSSSSSEDEEEEEESWGRNYYSSNAAQIDSGDEEALELEENESRRLQAKARDGMDENDFGLNDPYYENAKEADGLPEPAQAVLPVLPQDRKSIMRHLQKNNPEALALAGDWEDSIQNLTKTREKLDKIQSTDPDSHSLGMIHLYYQTLVTYTTNLAFYLHIRANEKYARRLEALSTHPILARLLTLKQGLMTMEGLDFAPTDSEGEFDEDSEMELDELEISERLVTGIGRLEAQELSKLLKDALLYQERPGKKIQQDTPQKPPKKKRKTSRESSELAQPIFDVIEPEFKSSKLSSKAPAKDIVSDVYGEALSLQHADAADKIARRKSLRFHAAKIESTSARRQGARQSLGGDDDIPYRGRRKEREVKVLKEVKERIEIQGGADLDNTEPEQRRKPQNEEDGSDEDADLDGYYDLVKKRSKERKEKKRADYEAMKAAARQNQDEEDANGPRSLTKTILTNRGLTPHRPKSSRNPRVRKREKYEKAKKKVASQKAVYKNGLAGTGGRYEGERSGISKVVKSVRLA
ncbi:hypothetical protein AX15_000009 [Amanita polypyramis BW_CC]|nr:hypothetical protein AX15_000009 [Amanita polypyramis BW_CC]